jgi:hypothetical protein
MIEALDDEPLLHTMMGACRDIILQAFPCLSDGLIRELLKPRDLVLEGICFAQRKKNLARNALEHFSQVGITSLLKYNHCFAFPNNENGKRQRRTAS